MAPFPIFFFPFSYFLLFSLSSFLLFFFSSFLLLLLPHFINVVDVLASFSSGSSDTDKTRWLDAFNPPKEGTEDIYSAWDCPQARVLLVPLLVSLAFILFH